MPELANRVDANGAVLGALVSLQPPTRNMLIEAAEERVYEVPGIFNQTIPKIRIITVEDLLGGKRPELPHGANQTLSQIRGMLPPDPRKVRRADDNRKPKAQQVLSGQESLLGH